VRQETKVKAEAGCAQVIPNGISPALFPEHQVANISLDEPGLAITFGPDDDLVAAKRANLLKFQHQMKLRQDADALLLYWPSRLDPSQKGVELLEDIAQPLVEAFPGVQIAVLGDPVGSDHTHADIIGRIACASEGRIAYHRFDEQLSLLGYAAATDVFGASLYEPFGQIDVMGNLYGATATNRDTGGYHDKISTLRLKAWGAPIDRGNGVLFKNYDSGGLWWALARTVDNHRYFQQNRHEWVRQMQRIMKEARERWSLDNMVARYITVYEQLNGNNPLA
jgi:glycogen synthase